MAKLSSIADSLGWKLLGRNLGRGGQGDVELVERKSEPGGRPYAFKLLADRGGPKANQRFRQELAALTKLNHKNIVKVVNFAQRDDGPQYYVMEYIEGAKSLRQRMDQNVNPFHRDPLRAVEAFIEIVEALAECEKISVVHRDLSPANVLVTDDGHILLIDFGLCHIEDGNRVTLTDEAVGTPHYRPPECSGYSSLPVSIRADLYSAGKILWSMVTNRMAFDRERPIFNDQSLFKMLPDLMMSWHFHHIFERTVRHEPGHRYLNAAQAIAGANMARRLIINRYMPFEALAEGTCTHCGVGRLQHPVQTKYNEAINSYYRQLQHIIHACWICPYCFSVTFMVDEAQKQFSADRMKLE